MRGWREVSMADIARMQRKDAPAAKPSKYRNVKTEVLGIVFDSKREAAEYLRLHARAQVGEITNLRRQVSFALYTARVVTPGHGNDAQAAMMFEVARYIADFVYEENGQTHVVDAKGKRTAMYQLKKKWLELQSGIVIEEV